MKNVQSLYDFIDRAVKNRKYAENTGGGFRAALRLFEKELNEDERNSIEKIEANIQEIYRNVAQKNKTYTAGSLDVYRKRVKKLIGDYKKYGTDPTQMTNWSVRTVTRASKNKAAKVTSEEPLDNIGLPSNANVHKIELSLRPDTKCLIMVPKDMKKEEATIIKTIIDSLTS